MKHLTLFALFCAINLSYSQELDLEQIATLIVDHKPTKADIFILEEMKQNDVCLEYMQLAQQLIDYEAKQQGNSISKEELESMQFRIDSLATSMKNEREIANENLALYKQARQAKDEERAKTYYQTYEAHKTKAKTCRQEYNSSIAEFNQLVAEYNNQANSGNLRRQQIQQEKLRVGDILSKCYYDFGADN